jgi:peptidoglycan/LPS O-acetylase OafA/YrhL
MIKDIAGAERSPRVELGFLDGIRGLCALYVAAYHAYLFTGHTGDAERHLPVLGWFVLYGYLGVPVFIVLSGFVLMLPVARAGPALELRGGFWSFMRRRARRILPPYYGALALSLVLIAAIPTMRENHATQWDSKIPVSAGAVASHVLLVHDLFGSWIEKIDGPLWSVAVEWQIYFFMPLVLLPLWRRMRPVLVVGLCLLAAVPFAVTGRFGGIHAWFLALFAMGMLAAQITVGRRLRGRLLGRLSGVGLAVAVALLVGERSFMREHLWASESLIGILTAVVISWLVTRSTEGRPVAVTRYLESPQLMGLGLVSYSVYLLHSPLLGLGNLITLDLGMTTLERYLVMTFVVLPTAVGICAAFYWAVERNFKNSHQKVATAGRASRTDAPAAPRAVVSVTGITSSG